MSGSGRWNGWIERVGRLRRCRLEGRRRKLGMLRQVRSTCWRDSGHVRWRGSAHRIRVVAVNGSLSSLLPNWSGLRRRRPGAGFIEAPLVSAAIVEGSALDLIGWYSYVKITVAAKDSTALLFERAAVIECPGCLSHQTVGSWIRKGAIRTWCVVKGNVPATERVLERAIRTGCVAGRNVRATQTTEELWSGKGVERTISLAVGSR
jgi:hypothetical protein